MKWRGKRNFLPFNHHSAETLLSALFATPCPGPWADPQPDDAARGQRGDETSARLCPGRACTLAGAARGRSLFSGTHSCFPCNRSLEPQAERSIFPFTSLLDVRSYRPERAAADDSDSTCAHSQECLSALAEGRRDETRVPLHSFGNMYQNGKSCPSFCPSPSGRPRPISIQINWISNHAQREVCLLLLGF